MPRGITRGQLETLVVANDTKSIIFMTFFLMIIHFYRSQNICLGQEQAGDLNAVSMTAACNKKFKVNVK